MEDPKGGALSPYFPSSLPFICCLSFEVPCEILFEEKVWVIKQTKESNIY